MNFDNYFKKLPKSLQSSDRFAYYCIEFSKFLRKRSKPKQKESNSYLDFLVKSTDFKFNGLIRDMQLLLCEMLIFFDNVCRKHDLDYMLCYGTLLGAVRHGGFIPWDDDVDLIMMRKDYSKLIKVLPDEINKYPFLKDNFGLTLLKKFNENYFKDMNDIYTSQYVDFFYSHDLDYKGPFLQMACLNPFAKIDVFPFDFIKGDFIKQYNKKYLSQKYLFAKAYKKPDFVYETEFKSRSEKLGVSNEETDYIGEGIDASRWEDFGVMKKELLFPVKEITYEGHSFKCPNNTHEMLKLCYGESYMELPSNIEIPGFVEYNKLLFDDDEEKLRDSFKYAREELNLINETFDKK